MRYKESYKFEVDSTIYYRKVFGDKKKKVTCALCGKVHFYNSGEMIYKHNELQFCGRPCQIQWRKENPDALPDNPYIPAISKYDKL